MVSHKIKRKRERLREAILRDIRRTAVKEPAGCALSMGVVLDATTEMHLRCATRVFAGTEGEIYIEVFDNYDETTETVNAASLPTDTLNDILNNL